MKSFKNHSLTEQVRASHAAKYMNYEEKYHHKLGMALRDELINNWQADIKRMNDQLDTMIKKQHSSVASQDHVNRMKETNPDVKTTYELVDKPESLSSSRWIGSKFVGPSVKIPISILSTPHRIDAINFLLDAAEGVFHYATKKIGKILDLSGEDSLPSLFRVVRDHEDVKLQFVSSKGGHETAKTIFKVAVEHGRPGSKTKDFDRVFFIDNLT